MIGQADITQVGMLLGAVATLGSVIAYLWKNMLNHFTRVDERLSETQAALNDCQEDRLMIWKTIANQAGCQVEELRGKNK